MAIAIPSGVSTEMVTTAMVSTASADLVAMAAWAGPTVSALALGLAVKVHRHNKAELKRAEARVKVAELLTVVDKCEDRAVIPADVAEIKAFGPSFGRLAKVLKKVREVEHVNTAIKGVVDIPPLAAGGDPHLYQQRLGEAMGRLKDVLEAAYEALSV
ncbi:hypothetical protein ACFUJ0_13955 [Streptomyces sp. NPDC057242]|uniref:hypothetical protein n=2 Tax=Streptomyces TaxID=1883 RepID=UPI003645B4E7